MSFPLATVKFVIFSLPLPADVLIPREAVHTLMVDDVYLHEVYQLSARR